MSNLGAFYVSLALFAVAIVGGVHLLGFLMRSRGDKGPEISERAYRIAQIITLAETRFEGDTEKVVTWLCQPQLGLEDIRPIDMLNSPEGAKKVEDLLGRMENGVVR